MTLHILHIRKSGGTALKAALEPIAPQFAIKLHSHNTRLCDVPGEKVAFALRHPVSRFISGFECRKRTGAPRYDIPWRPGEARAFALFESANALAEALDNGPLQREAWAAMSAIPHLAVHLRNWLTVEDVMRRKNIFWIGMQETLVEDFERLRSKAGLPSHVLLPDDPVVAHRAPTAPEKISEHARLNIAAWYAEDVAIYNAARERSLVL